MDLSHPGSLASLIVLFLEYTWSFAFNLYFNPLWLPLWFTWAAHGGWSRLSSCASFIADLFCSFWRPFRPRRVLKWILPFCVSHKPFIVLLEFIVQFWMEASSGSGIVVSAFFFVGIPYSSPPFGTHIRC